MGLFWLLRSGPSNDPSRQVFPNFWSACRLPTVCTVQHGCILYPGIVSVVANAISPEICGRIAALSELADLRCVSSIDDVFVIALAGLCCSPCLASGCLARIAFFCGSDPSICFVRSGCFGCHYRFYLFRLERDYACSRSSTGIASWFPFGGL